MPGIANGSFEIGGTTPGEASQWTLTSQQAGADTALFDVLLEGLTTPHGAESFEWFTDLVDLDSVGTESAGVDDFESGWQNDAFIRDLSANTETAQFDTTPQAFDDFEEEWPDNEDFAFNWSEIAGSDTASFDAGTPQDFEDFEEEWLSNEDFAFDFFGFFLLKPPCFAHLKSSGEYVFTLGTAIMLILICDNC